MLSRRLARTRAPFIVVLLVALAAVIPGCSLVGEASPAGASRPVPPAGTISPAGTIPPAATVVPSASIPAVDPASGLPAVALRDLPDEAAQVVALINAGGPFPYRQDGAIFENREGLLPARPGGHYREYTVPTPGADDRGARRIVTGADGQMYWTADHYDSFAWIAR